MPPDLCWTLCITIVFVLLPKDIRETILGVFEQFVMIGLPCLAGGVDSQGD